MSGSIVESMLSICAHINTYYIYTIIHVSVNNDMYIYIYSVSKIVFDYLYIYIYTYRYLDIHI